MIELLRDPIWQFVGAFLALLTIGLSYALYRSQRERKDLSYDIVLNSPILSVIEEDEGKLQLLYEGHPIKDPRILFVYVENTGNTPIPASDYERPIALDFGEGAKVLSAVVAFTVPKSLILELERKDHVVTIKPALLNPGDSARLKLLVSHYGASPHIDGRVHGVKALHPVVEKLWEHLIKSGQSTDPLP
ncbi:hypothetical protein [Plasticicumulans lactativorans]|uniref:hypothetical protein n=1 Tax=Plasticicumulans lactativorans TaxID=1133106 RepID=UPI001044E5C6|nr:hypothetical protein [Plasticicumulans lactativorans]